MPAYDATEVTALRGYQRSRGGPELLSFLAGLGPFVGLLGAFFGTAGVTIAVASMVHLERSSD